MTKSNAEKAIRDGALAALFLAIGNFIITSIALLTDSATGSLALFNYPWNMAYIAIILVLAYFISQKSRIAAVLILGYYLTVLFLNIWSGQLSGGAMFLVFVWFFARAVWATNVWHRLDRTDEIKT